MQKNLADNERKLLETYRAQLVARDYAPIDDGALKIRRKAHRNAVASAAIEGLQATPMQEALFAMLDELRVPDDLSREIVDLYLGTRFPKAS